MTKSRVWALVPASGIGSRMQADIPKQYLTIAGRTVLEHTLSRLNACPSVDKMLIAISSQDTRYKQLAYTHCKLHKTIQGGAERVDSVRNMLNKLVQIEPDAWALVHDAVRPCVSIDDIEYLVKTAVKKGYGGLLGVPMADTVKQANEGGEVIKTVPRSHLWRAFTPQIFRASELYEALQSAENIGVTDEASAIESMGGNAFLLEGSSDNLKITRPADLALAELIIAAQFSKNNS